MAERNKSTNHHLVTIIGAGFSGLCMAIRLRQQGIDDFVILEKADEVGGTWYVNTYPGAACDIPSHLYSFSFEPWPNWSRTFATQPEIQQYIVHCTQKHGLRPFIRLNTAAVECRFDPATQLWTVLTSNGHAFTSQFLVLGTGGLSIPSYPNIEGLHTFAGPRFHSAEWNHSVDLTNKHVAVIGTGASAIQFVPQIAPKAAKLSLFQRTAPWVLPRPDRAYSSTEKWLFKNVPFTAWLHRQAIYWRHEFQGLGFVKSPSLLRVAEWMGLRNIKRGIKSDGLRQAVRPPFHIGCKRILMANDYYPTLARENVEVITAGIDRVVADGLLTTDGRHIPADVLIYGTGFRIADYLWPLKVFGTAGRDMREVWADRPKAYLGISVHGFPNCFLLVGPNTGLGHNSMIFMIEAQVEHILSVMQALRQTGKTVAEVRAQAENDYTNEMQHGMQGTVWLTGCQSWYLSDDGSNYTLWPRLTWQYRLRTAKFHPKAYALT